MASLKQLITEIHRRSLWQVLAIYVVASWAVLEAADVLVERLALPEWVYGVAIILLLIGLPIVLATAFVQEGISPTQQHDPTLVPGAEPGSEARAREVAGARRLLTWRNAITGGVLALALSGVVAAGWLLLGPEERASMAAGTLMRKSIAVLPFANLSADEENAFFASGIHEDILTYLSKVADLRVISRSSVMKYADANVNSREVAGELGVAYILEGSVRRSGNRVRITAQLIDAQSDEHLWAENFDRELADVFEIQTAVAQQIVAQLQARLSPEERQRLAEVPTDDVEAYDLYLKAREIIRGGQIDAEAESEAARLLERAVELDPEFALAHVMLADVSGDIYWFAIDRTPERLATMKAAIDRAFQLQPDLPEARMVLAEYYYRGFYDYERALEQLEIAHRQLPNNADILYMMGLTYRRLGLWDESIASFEESAILDPENIRNYGELLNTQLNANRPDEGEVLARRLLEKYPRHGLISAHLALILLNGQGDVEEARRVLADATPTEDWYWALASLEAALYARDFDAAASVAQRYKRVYDTIVPGTGDLYAGEVEAARGDEARAREHFMVARGRFEEEIAKPYSSNYMWPHVLLAMTEAYLGEREKAIASCERAAAILPYDKDRVHGMWVPTYCAFARARLGDVDFALAELERVIDLPSGYSRRSLALDPRWDFMRGNPRFDALTRSADGL
jgi:TolB-like protein/Tfp pilus assembly protein PilF